VVRGNSDPCEIVHDSLAKVQIGPAAQKPNQISYLFWRIQAKALIEKSLVRVPDGLSTTLKLNSAIPPPP
jgi:hypothetical protein